MYTILLIGAGQIGSRYLCGLVNINKQVKIIVVEPNVMSQTTSKQRWLDAGGDKSGHQIKFMSDLSLLYGPVDLAIIATSSQNRSSVIQNVALKVNPQYWVIEKILAQSNVDLDSIQHITSKAKGTWVNTPRRLMIWHQGLKRKFSGQGPFRVTKSGGLWGLACNAIHFIDLVSWWTEESLLSVDNTNLSKAWYESKRAGYFEINGELRAKFSGGTELILRSDPDILEDVMHLKFRNNCLWVINEEKSTAFISGGREFLNGIVEYQSNITATMVNKILMNGTCDLPRLEDSIKQHRIFIQAMLDHWRNFSSSTDETVPIT